MAKPLKVWNGSEWTDVSSFLVGTVPDTISSAAVASAYLRISASSDFLFVSSAASANIADSVVQRSSDGSFEISSISLNSDPGVTISPKKIQWNDADGTADLGLNSDVTLQIGQEVHVRVANESGSTVYNGQLVYVVGSGEASPDHPPHPLIAPFPADGSINPERVIGVATHDIPDDEHGYITSFGVVREVNTSSYSSGTILYGDPDSPGGWTNSQPISPDVAVVAGVVVSSSVNGSILVHPRTYPSADVVTYNNEDSAIIATNVKGALDELSIGKADVTALSSNITLYATTASSSEVSGYFRMVDSTTSSYYNTTPVDVATGAITSSGQFISALVSASGILEGNPGIIGITTVGNIAKTAGNSNNYADFYFQVYKRDASDVETLIGTSSHTPEVNPEELDVYQQFSTAALVNFGYVDITDRIVVKYYANIVQGSSAQYKFQFGGGSPVRTLIPVPVSVIPLADASGVEVNTDNFNGVLSFSNTTVQSALETLDDIDLLPSQTGNAGKFLKTDGANASWDDVDAVALGGNLPEHYLSYESASTIYLNQANASAQYAPLQDFNNLLIANHMGIY